MRSGTRCLIVDDDDWTRDYVRELVSRLGIDTESACDGVEASAMLDETTYEVVFLDLDLPNMPGEAVLQSLVTSRKRPGSIVVMSGAPDRLAKIPPSEWRRLGITAALPKPLVAEDIRIAVERMRTPSNVTFDPMSIAAPGTVLLAGSGLWCDAARSVAVRGGGNALMPGSFEEAMTLVSRHRPEAVIAGPPLSESELLQFCGAAARTSPESVVIAAVSRADMQLRRALADVGVAKVCVVPSAGGDLAVAMINAAHLTTRSHTRVKMTGKATVTTRDGRVSASTQDISEGGVCLVEARERIPRGPAKVEFGMPGDGRLVVADSEIVWSASGSGEFRAGVAFKNLSSTDQIRIRGFVGHHS